ncbi:unnamed protein product [Didymodactylos carnosus]|nr:unnamed protein product [Didymodactylos carnosus]
MLTLFGASDSKLLRNISNWLTGSASDWYLQLSQAHRLPETWSQYKRLFLARFRSPERVEALKIERSRCAQKENETAADFYQRYLGLNLEINPKSSEKQLKKYFMRKLRPALRLWMKGDPERMSIDEILKMAEKAEIELLYQRKEEVQRAMPESWTSRNLDAEQDDSNSQELTRSLTRQLARLRTPEKTVVVANLESPSSANSFSQKK